MAKSVGKFFNLVCGFSYPVQVSPSAPPSPGKIVHVTLSQFCHPMGYQHRYTGDVTLVPRFIYRSHFFTAGFYIGIYIPAGHKTLVQKNARHYRHSDYAVNLSSMPDYPMHYDMIL